MLLLEAVLSVPGEVDGPTWPPVDDLSTVHCSQVALDGRRELSRRGGDAALRSYREESPLDQFVAAETASCYDDLRRAETCLEGTGCLSTLTEQHPTQLALFRPLQRPHATIEIREFRRCGHDPIRGRLERRCPCHRDSGVDEGYLEHAMHHVLSQVVPALPGRLRATVIMGVPHDSCCSCRWSWPPESDRARS